MPKLRVHNFCVSLDGYGAGPDQSLDHPIGVGGLAMHDWVFETRHGRRLMGLDPTGGTDGVDDGFIARGDQGIGATIMGRNMFGPVRGSWEDESWTGWWGEEPPYHHPVFVLTHHPRPSIPMKGGTVFHFVADGIESALAQAYAAADGRDVRLGGGVSAIRQYIAAGLLDELHVVITPVLLRGGERLFEPGQPAGLEVAEFVTSPAVAHAVLTKA